MFDLTKRRKFTLLTITLKRGSPRSVRQMRQLFESDGFSSNHKRLQGLNMWSREQILGSRWLRPFAHLFAHPSLWHLNRRSVPRALALGLFAAFILPIGHFAFAALLAVPLRANVSLAAGSTLVVNPLTFTPIYYAAYELGMLLLHHPSHPGMGAVTHSLGQTILDVSGPTALGLSIFAIVSAAAGYAIGTLVWRLRLVRRWERRRD